MRIEETKVYTFDELSDDAKDTARNWYRRSSDGDTYWSESVLEQGAEVCRILGIELATRPVKLMNGDTRREPVIYFSGFSSQGDGACFEGTYRYAPGAARKLRAEYPQDEPLHRIAVELQQIQRAWFYRLEASISHRGNYYHSMSVSIDVDDASGLRTVDDRTAEDISDALRDVMNWIYRRLEAEYEYQNSDEVIDENMRANEYEFTESGERF
jgi:hypothetical protein